MAVVATTTPFVVSCSSQSTRVVQVQTLKSVGASAESAVEISAMMYRDGTITAKQALEVTEFYDQKFQPAYRFAIAAAKSDLSTIASPDLLLLANQLSQLILSFQHKTS